MHRKSAYILFLAVLGLLVIGIVMLFSTSAFARSSHGDVYFFIRRQAIWFGIGLFLCILAALIDYHFWQRTWWLWFVLAVIVLALCYVPNIGMRINGSRRWIGVGPVTFQPSELAKLATIFFLAAWFTRYEKSGGNLLFGFALPLAIVGVLGGLVLAEVDLGTTALLGITAFVVMFIAGANPLWLGHSIVRRPRRSYHRCYANLGANGAALCLSSSGKFQGGCGFAADAGLDRLGQRWDGRPWPGQWPPEDALPALRAHRFHISHHRRRARSAVQSAGGLLICGHHCLRNHDRAARERPFWSASRLWRCFAVGFAGGGKHWRHHIAPPKQRSAAALYQLWRFKSRRLYVRGWLVAEYLSAGHS